jgi:hypothetical protein
MAEIKKADEEWRKQLTPLFQSDTKYDSGNGWPSFWSLISPDNVWVEIAWRCCAASAMHSWATFLRTGQSRPKALDFEKLK